uniref:Transmembrane protein 273 n=1 Tax=Chelydra serpentina TaxID=8475 RepID=A0A8C3T5T1_CHESE
PMRALLLTPCLTEDPKYVIIGVTLGVFLAIGFLALKICMIKRQLIDNDFVGKRNILLLSDFRGNFFSPINRRNLNSITLKPF